MRRCNTCSRFTFGHDPSKNKNCPQCKTPWTCDMCDGDYSSTGGTPAGEKCWLCSGGHRELAKWRKEAKEKKIGVRQ